MSTCDTVLMAVSYLWSSRGTSFCWWRYLFWYWRLTGVVLCSHTAVVLAILKDLGSGLDLVMSVLCVVLFVLLASCMSTHRLG